MSILNNSLLLGADAGGYQISRSLRFNSSDSAYLSRTPASAGNRKTWTFSFWAKRSNIVTRQLLLEVFATANDTGYFAIEFTSDATAPYIAIGGYNTTWRRTSQVFRDTSAWYHIVLAVDTTQATANNRIRLYVNGIELTDFNILANPSPNADTGVNAASLTTIGSGTAGSNSYSGYLADIHFIDGQALTPSSFAETNATTGQWVPKTYSGSYGTNGFQLKFADNSAATATTLGKDTSGNGNNWTPNNLSVTAGAGNDSLVDTPTSYGTGNSGGDVRGNYCTWNPLDKNTSFSAANGNLDASATVNGNIRGTLGVSSGKWYWEYMINNTNPIVGIASAAATLADFPGIDANGYGYYSSNGNRFNNSGTGSSYGATYTTGDIIGVALDLDAGTLVFYKNGVSQGTAFSGIPTGTYFPAAGRGNGTFDVTLNAGARPFAYTAPSGFKALCDTNLPAPVVAKPSTVMDVKLWTGNNTTQVISGLNFESDLIWMKNRSVSGRNHYLFDSVRGLFTSARLMPNVTDAEATHTQYLSASSSTSFTLTAGDAGSNNSGETYVGWCWDAGSSTVTNTSGSISSQVRANASAGFSIVTYTGTSSSPVTIGHGLGAVPGFIIIKNRSLSSNWYCYHSSLGASTRISLQSTDAAFVGTGLWNNTSPSSTVFTTVSDTTTNNNGSNHVAYCFAPVAGYSAFGSYTGNGSSDGPFVFTGFRPALVLVRRTDSSGDWRIWDMRRDRYNVTFGTLAPNTSAAENTAEGSEITGIDFLSNGFKLRSTGTNHNASGGTFIYAAFAESPFQYARAR